MNGMELASTVVSPRQRIIDAAERLFASKGLHGTGLREIARAADVNVNSIIHHFEGKDDLYLHIQNLRAVEINTKREAMLDELDHRYAPESPPTRDIIFAFIHPIFQLRRSDPMVWANFSRGYMREFGTNVWREVNAQSVTPAMRRFTAILHRSLPAAKRSDIILILSMAFHSVGISVDGDEASLLGDDLARELSPDDLEDRLLTALTGAALQFS